MVLLSVNAFSQDKMSFSIIQSEMIFVEAPFAQCHASTITGTNEGNLIAAWFGGSYEGANDVCIWLSEKTGQTWSSPTPVAYGICDDKNLYACWNPVLFKPDDKLIYLYYKVGPSPREWWGMLEISDDNGTTWSEPQRLSNILGPVRNKPLILQSGTWLNPSSIETQQRWQVFIERSVDQGKNWSIVPVDTANIAKAIQPALLTYPGGKIQALCRSNQNCVLQSWSMDDGISWGPFEKTTLQNPNSAIDAITLHSGLQLIVYNPAISGSEWSDGRSKLNMAISTDGINWTDCLKLEDQDKGEFSYPAIIQTSDGMIHITYTYSRKNIKHVVVRQD